MSATANNTAELNPLQLGFAEEGDPWALISHFFPNKIGGRPAWLALDGLPSGADLQCQICGQPMTFLLQLYNPIDERDDCFHRTLFLFMCLNGACYQQRNDARPLAVFRCQLSRKNEYYSFKPPPSNPTEAEVTALLSQGELSHAGLYQDLCAVCGCPGSKRCAACAAVNYCSKLHQTMHWKSGHKAQCPHLANTSQQDGVKSSPPRGTPLNFATNSCLLPEFELAGNPYPDQQDGHHSNQDQQEVESSSESEDDDVEDIEEKENEVIAAGDGSNCALPQTQSSNLTDDASLRKKSKEQKRLHRLKRAMSRAPDQVLRCQRGGRPIWLDDPPASIAPCQNCGAERVFEIQVTPQLLSHLKLDRIDSANGTVSGPDWGCLYVFTCSASCNPAGTGSSSQQYLPELIVRQDV